MCERVGFVEGESQSLKKVGHKKGHYKMRHSLEFSIMLSYQ